MCSSLDRFGLRTSLTVVQVDLQKKVQHVKRLYGALAIVDKETPTTISPHTIEQIQNNTLYLE